MKQQVSRLSPHQDGKVFGVWIALSSLMFVVPFVLYSTSLHLREVLAPQF